MLKQSLQAILLLIALGVIWASGYSIAHFCTTHGVPPLGYAFWQSLGPAVILTLLCQTSPENITLNRKHIPFYIICGLIGIAIPNTNMYFSAKHLPAGLLSVIVNTVPIMTYVIAFALKEEKLSTYRLLGVLLCVSGIMMLVFPEASLPNAKMVPWILSSLITPACFAICAVYSVKFRPPHTHSMTLSAGMLISSTVLLLPVIIASKDFYSLWHPFQLRDWLIVLEIILSSLGYMIFFRLLKIAGAVFYSLVGGVVAIIGLLWGWIFFHEDLSPIASVAVFFIIAGIVIVPTLKKAPQ